MLRRLWRWLFGEKKETEFKLNELPISAWGFSIPEGSTITGVSFHVGRREPCHGGFDTMDGEV